MGLHSSVYAVVFLALMAVCCLSAKTEAGFKDDLSLIKVFEGVAHNTLSSIKQWQRNAVDGKSVFGFERELGSIWQNSITCSACHAGMNSINWVLSRDNVRNAAEYLISYGCSYFLNGTVCSGAVHEMGDVLVPQLTEFLLTGDYSCSRLFGFCGNPTWVTLNSEDYVRRVISEKPDIIKNNDFIDNLYKEIKNDTNPRDVIRILHMSDLHLDLEYSPGSSIDCGEPLCCRKNIGPTPPSAEDAAGIFGAYNCDLPVRTLESMFYFVRDMENGPDLVMWTGDNVAHDIWNQTNHKNTEATIKITEFIKAHWPEMPVFVSTGNHEFYPVNVESFKVDNQPILELLAEHWKDWIDDDTMEQFKKYGYYHLKLKDLNEDFENVRVITLNTQSANDLNWSLLTTLNDPGNQLKWLEEQLKEIEAAGDIVFILGHIPPQEGLHEWSIRYKALVERFQHIIRFQGFGHTHNESYTTVRGAFDYKPIGSYHIAGSVTTFTGKNPSFRIMDFDRETMLPVKMHTYFLNITKANLEGSPQWEYGYEFTETYEIEDLSPSSLYKLTDNFFEKPELAVKFLRHRYGQGGPDGSGITSCTEGCLWNLKCDLSSSEKQLQSECLGVPFPDYINDLYSLNFNEYLFDPWIVGPEPRS